MGHADPRAPVLPAEDLAVPVRRRADGRAVVLAAVAAALASGALPYSTGQVINADGGLTIQRL